MMKDCESSLTMRVKCPRFVFLWSIIPLCLLCSTLQLYIAHSSLVVPKKQSSASHLRPGAALRPNATVSACLLIKDDNDILHEWISYHYFSLRLRHLVIAVDPQSIHSPLPILEQWKAHLRIENWSDTDFMPSYFQKYKKPPRQFMEDPSRLPRNISQTEYLQISTHRYRQRVFLSQCLQHLQSQGATWVMHIDTDEYVVPSKLLRQMRPRYLQLPDLSKEGSMLKLLQQVVYKTKHFVSYPCISMLRVLFGSVPSTDVVSQKWNLSQLETMQWRRHALPHNRSLHGNPKVLLDVSVIPQLPDMVFSIHRPLVQYCPRHADLDFRKFRKQPLAVNHYLGSYQRYASRSDIRRSRLIYERKAQQSRGRDDGIVGWMDGFYRTSIGYRMLQQYRLLPNKDTNTTIM